MKFIYFLLTMKFIYFLLCIVIILQIILMTQNNSNEYYYETRLINLNNSNVLIYENIIEYVCDDWVEVKYYKLFFEPNVFYASTWTNYEHPLGQCLIKIKIKVE